MNEQLLSIIFSSKTKYFSMAIICICVFASIITGPILIPFAFIIASAAFAITAFSDDGPVFLRFFTIALFISILIITKGSITTAFGGITLFLPGGLSLAWSAKKKKHLKKIHDLRKEVGVVFQFSENQLFEDTVIKDVMFGVQSFYPKIKNPEELAIKALKLVGLDESFYERSPFDLSGGEKKRVAIAGVMAYQPKLLII